MAESTEWVSHHYIPVVKCQKCASKKYFWNNRDSLSSYKETLSKLKEHIFNGHNITKHDSVHNIEYDENNEVPVRGCIRKHYSKLKDGVGKCKLCSKEIDYKSNYKYNKLHSHLKDNHKEKLTETEKNFVRRIRWYWDYFTEKDERAICNSCNQEFITSSEVPLMIEHLKFYMKPGPSSSSDTNSTNSNTDMGAHAKETNKCQENAHSPPMVEGKADDESVLQYYNPTLICKKCDFSHSLNNEASLSLSKETLTTLEEHLLDKHKIMYDSVQDDINKEEIPVRLYIQKHFSKLKEDMAKCNICFEVFNYQLKAYMLHKRLKIDKIQEEHLKYKMLHKHLKNNHEDKLTEIQKKEGKILWYWDHYTMENKHYWICNITTCKMRIKVRDLKTHFEAVHKKTGPSSISDTDNTDNDTDMGQPTKEADRQENTNSLQNRTAIMAEQKTEDNKWVLLYYNPTLTCHKCNVCFSSDNDTILSSKETLIKLKDHLLHEHKLNYDSMIEHNIQHNVNKEQIPVRDFIRKHYTKLRGDTAKCNYCFEVISYTYMYYSSLHDHLKCKHDKLTEVEKKDINFPWYSGLLHIN